MVNYMCLDPCDLNAAIKRPYYPVPTLKDVTSKLAGARHFSVLDICSGYWQIKRADSTSRQTTFNTAFGRYRYLHMPFGINAAQDVFQHHVDATYKNLPRITSLNDDVLVAGTTRDKHLQTLCATFQCARENSQHYNLNKCRFNLSEVSYYGHVISSDGMKPDAKKAEAIVKMAKLANKKV